MFTENHIYFILEKYSSMKVKVTESSPTLCDPMEFRVQGILQARILECIAFPFSRVSSQRRDRTQVSRIAGGFFTTGPPGKSLLLALVSVTTDGTDVCANA